MHLPLSNKIRRFTATLLTVVFVTIPLVARLARADAKTDAAAMRDPHIHEQVLSVPGDPARPVMLQVTFYTPDGAGPFPLAVLNHGKDSGDPRLQPRNREVYVSRYFLSRGYAVALPMLRGFAGSGGVYDPHGCDAEADGLSQAKDLRAVLDYLVKRPDIDARHIVMFGQSYGGWNTLAFGTLNYPGVRGLVNADGGRRAPTCPDWERELAIAAGHYARQTQVPSIWFYGDNDSTFPVSTWRRMYERYTALGGRAELVAFGCFMKDAHHFLEYPEGLSQIWTPKMDGFLARIGLPSRILHPELLPTSFPAPTHFAAIDDVNAVPLVNNVGRRDYRAFLTRSMPRVFAIAPDGTAVTTNGGYDPLARALKLCRKYHRVCRPYAVDDEVVWPIPTPVPPATHFAQIDNVAAVPYLNNRGREVGYRRFLTLGEPRAFVIAPDGAWAYSERGFDPLNQALEACEKKHQGCRLYAVDNHVVWHD